MDETTPTKRRHDKSIRAFYPFMMVSGIIQILAPASINIIMQQLGIEEHLGGLFQVVYFSGLLLGTLLLTRFMQRYTIKQIMLIQALLLVASLFAASAAPWYFLLLIFFFFTGFANGTLITLPAIYATGVCGEDSPRVQNILYGFFSVGFVLGPLIAALIARENLSWRWCLAIPAMLALPLMVPIALTGMKKIPKPDKLSIASLRKILSFNRSLFIGLVLAFLLYAAGNASVKTWLVTFLEIEKGMVSGSAHVVLVGTATSLTLGRWACSYLSRNIDPLDILTFISISAGILVFLAPLPSSKAASIVLYLLLGFANSGIYPFLIGYSAWFPEGESSVVITSAVAAAGVGGIIFPYLIGILNQHINPILGMSSASVFAMGVVACVFWIKPHVIKSP
ncbi:MAG: MFS transporter [Actinomycetota bacterium]|nr:MFS transporter [Actinomycetota bacterium]